MSVVRYSCFIDVFINNVEQVPPWLQDNAIELVNSAWVGQALSLPLSVQKTNKPEKFEVVVLCSGKV